MSFDISTSTLAASPVSPGLDVFCSDPPAELKGARLGLLCNPASLTSSLEPASEAVERVFPGGLRALFSPQHGFFADKQDNMVESPHREHPLLKIPVYSLYGQTRRPAREMLEGMDVLLVDLLDVGCRVYTFFSTVKACLEEAAAAGIEVWILDRPNPLGRGREGPILPPELMSFVGPHAMPLRHGLSMGELCLLAKAEDGLDLKLEVVTAQGWNGGGWAEAGLRWIMPSPNLPTLDSALVYPGQVLLEGTTLSEGRGTTRPFEIFGAPTLDPWAVAEQVEKKAMDGAFLRPVFFEPTFHKHAAKTCGGFQMHVMNVGSFRPLRASLAVLSAVARAHPGLWSLRPPPYEYEHERRPLDLILGDPGAVDALAQGALALDLEQAWQGGLKIWGERIKPYLLYPG